MTSGMVAALTTAVVASTLGLVAPPAAAEPAVSAVAAWSMVPQSKDVNRDGIIDGDGGVPASGALSLQPSPRFVGAGNRVAQPNERLIGGTLSWYLSDRGFPVRLNACRSSGDRYRWRIARDGSVIRTTKWRTLTRRTCRQTVTLPESSYDLALEVRGSGSVDRTRLTADVRNILVVALGDSYASGEGNPRNVKAWMKRGGSLSPYWDDDGCRRSARGAPALAALGLERSSSTTSVTLIDVACSGATVDAGILGPQLGAQQATSQIEQAARLMAGHAADAVLLTVGGNDVGFTSILQTCALSNDCPLARPPAGPLSGFPSVQSGVQSQTGALADDFARIAACLGGSNCRLADGRPVDALPLSPSAPVLPTLYPDITRAADGRPCTYLTISSDDFAWARSTILSPAPPPTYPYTLASGRTVDLPGAQGSLNQQIAATSRFTDWTPVGGTWSASGDTPGGHGVCAGNQAWVFGFTGLSGFTTASFHPNPTGQDVMARAISDAAMPLLRP